jgi:hypothetical protein
MSSFHSPKLELKYCERCGGLWLRPQGGEEVYCARCVQVIHELPAVKPRGAMRDPAAAETGRCAAILPAMAKEIAGGIGA